ncbi:MAG TPA: hypothetical protein VGX68_08400 [Thermoanaerobaculia bacterium]|jgi:hypothetical protein|nr:hypothetical protein [Thermoanaerobaculia bacterium]
MRLAGLSSPLPHPKNPSHRTYEPQPRGQTNFPVFGENTARMNAALRNRYGFTAEQTASPSSRGCPAAGRWL